MILENQFSVSIPPGELFAALQDLERVAPCLPGAKITERVDPETYRGTVTVKVGPISVSYSGTAKVLETDSSGSRLVMRAEGRETRGAGSASSTITLTVEAADGGSLGKIHSDVTITGRVAQFGRGMIQDVGDRLLGQFAECLQSTFAAAPAEPAGAAPGGAAPAGIPVPAGLPARPAAAARPLSGLALLGILLKVLWARLLRRRR